MFLSRLLCWRSSEDGDDPQPPADSTGQRVAQETESSETSTVRQWSKRSLTSLMSFKRLSVHAGSDQCVRQGLRVRKWEVFQCNPLNLIILPEPRWGRVLSRVYDRACSEDEDDPYCHNNGSQLGRSVSALEDYYRRQTTLHPGWTGSMSWNGAQNQMIDNSIWDDGTWGNLSETVDPLTDSVLAHPEQLVGSSVDPLNHVVVESESDQGADSEDEGEVSSSLSSEPGMWKEVEVKDECQQTYVPPTMSGVVSRLTVPSLTITRAHANPAKDAIPCSENPRTPEGSWSCPMPRPAPRTERAAFHSLPAEPRSGYCDLQSPDQLLNPQTAQTQISDTRTNVGYNRGQTTHCDDMSPVRVIVPLPSRSSEELRVADHKPSSDSVFLTTDGDLYHLRDHQRPAPYDRAWQGSSEVERHGQVVSITQTFQRQLSVSSNPNNHNSIIEVVDTDDTEVMYCQRTDTLTSGRHPISRAHHSPGKPALPPKQHQHRIREDSFTVPTGGQPSYTTEQPSPHQGATEVVIHSTEDWHYSENVSEQVSKSDTDLSHANTSRSLANGVLPGTRSMYNSKKLREPQEPAKSKSRWHRTNSNQPRSTSATKERQHTERQDMFYINSAFSNDEFYEENATVKISSPVKDSVKAKPKQVRSLLEALHKSKSLDDYEKSRKICHQRTRLYSDSVYEASRSKCKRGPKSQPSNHESDGWFQPVLKSVSQAVQRRQQEEQRAVRLSNTSAINNSDLQLNQTSNWGPYTSFSDVTASVVGPKPVASVVCVATHADLHQPFKWPKNQSLDSSTPHGFKQNSRASLNSPDTSVGWQTPGSNRDLSLKPLATRTNVARVVPGAHRNYSSGSVASEPPATSVSQATSQPSCVSSVASTPGTLAPPTISVTSPQQSCFPSPVLTSTAVAGRVGAGVLLSPELYCLMLGMNLCDRLYQNSHTPTRARCEAASNTQQTPTLSHT